MTKSCLVIGDLNVDLIFSGLKNKPSLGSEVRSNGHYLDIGGSGGIFASVLSQLGIDAYICSIIGKDYFGKVLLDKLKNFEVKTDFLISKDNIETGITISIPYKKDKYQISSVEIFKEYIKDFNNIIKRMSNIKNLSHIHFPSYYMMRSFSRNYKNFIFELINKNKNITFSLDTNDDPVDNWDKDIFKILRHIDILFLNKKEALKISRESRLDLAMEKFKHYVETVILKLGGKGCIAMTPNGVLKEKSIETNLCDSTGAGDNFDAGFIYGFLNGLGIKRSLKIANLCGSKSVEQPGGVGSKNRFVKLKKIIRKFEK